MKVLLIVTEKPYKLQWKYCRCRYENKMKHVILLLWCILLDRRCSLKKRFTVSLP